MSYRIAITTLALGFFMCLPRSVSAQTQHARSSSHSAYAGPSLTAKLINADQKAKKKSATVSVSVRGLTLIDPDSVNEIPIKGEGHLHYQLDGGPMIATPSTKLSFHDLSSGPHTITVALAGNNHAPLGPSATLKVTVP